MLREWLELLLQLLLLYWLLLLPVMTMHLTLSPGVLLELLQYCPKRCCCYCCYCQSPRRASLLLLLLLELIPQQCD
jgi:hypothetical protein